MKTQWSLGLVLVLAGITLFVLQASGVFVERAGIEIGDVEVGVEAERSCRGSPGWPAAASWSAPSSWSPAGSRSLPRPR